MASNTDADIDSKCVVFCGWRGSGKDTFSNYLVNDFKFTRYAFADTLKDYCAEKYRINRHYFDDTVVKEVRISDPDSQAYNLTPRDLCIQVGKEYRDTNPDYWIERVFKKMEEQKEKHEQIPGKQAPNFVISDCRYPNELKQLKEHFGPDHCIAIWIHRWETPPSKDPSELSLGYKDCDLVLDNTKLLRYRTLETVIQKFLS